MQKTCRLPTEFKDADESPLLPDSEVASFKRRAIMSVGSKALSLSILLNLSFALYLSFFCFPLSQSQSRGRFMDLGLYCTLTYMQRAFDDDERNCVYENTKKKMYSAPASEHVEHVPYVFKMAFLDDTSPYQGWPDDEKDQLWQDMYSSEHKKEK